ncbi:MAG: ATP-binding protein [Leptospiraceae bacterium]|nr:ATP-binding protein [Leptospiraceae bacterium]
MEYNFTFNQRLLSQIFAKFSSTFDAFCELVNNSIQAKADQIQISIDEYPAEELRATRFKRIILKDTGIGVSKNEFKRKILEIATDIKTHGQGIGRFAALQIGSRVQIETVAYDQVDKQFYKSIFELNANELAKSKYLNEIKLTVDHVPLDGKSDTYYQVTISDFYEESIIQKEPHKRASKLLLPENIGSALFSRYPEQIFNMSIKFVVNNNSIDPKTFLIGTPELDKREFIDLEGNRHAFDFSFLNVKASGHNQKIFLRTSNNGLKSVAHSFNYKADIPDQNVWFIYVDSDYFDKQSDIFRNFQIQNLDEEASHITNEIKLAVDAHFAEKYQKYQNFIERLKGDRYYPYRNIAASSRSKEILFNQLAFYVEDGYQILQQGNKLRDLIYALIDKSLNLGDLEIVLSQIIKLDSSTVMRFKDLLDKVNLEDVIQFSEQVASKNQFLDFLHEILYGLPAKHVKERSQLHKIIERKLWLFGEQYNNTPQLFSDKKLETALNSLRDELLVYEPSKEDENVAELEDSSLRNISDLFFYNEKPLDDESREIMIVELKAPKVKLNQKELNQIEKYAYQIKIRGVFSSNYKYKVILIGSDLSDFVKTSLGQIDETIPTLYKRYHEKNIEVYVMKWSDLIQLHRKKLSYLGNALETIDTVVKDVFETEFHDIRLHRGLKSVINYSN